MAGVAVAAHAAGERFEMEFQVADGSWQRVPETDLDRAG
jgi:hypothetical protein